MSTANKLGAALLHPRQGVAMRAVLEGGKALEPSTKSVPVLALRSMSRWGIKVPLQCGAILTRLKRA